MDGWLKALVAAACVVVIAGGGWFAIGEYRKSGEAEAAQKESTMRSGCRQSLSPENKDYSLLRETCLNRGYITQSEFNAASN
ncbi:hypothetical protein [Ensifer sp.]|jgi:hypothetical protein|uniref:hypothetical protein n=1 Tax=Ensifer sp. TaxID=1872086 RepID=UPI002E152E55|nr:hypothetical protein [Ensifer sp.]